MKKIILIILTSIFVLFGCTDISNENSDNKVSTELMNIFPTVGTTATYFGIAEYGHSVTLNDVQSDGDRTTTYHVVGHIFDARGEEYNNRIFNISYIVDDDTIKEVIDNQDEFRTSSNVLHSIIPEQIILKLPLDVGNTWVQRFNYSKKQYIATTTITSINVTEKDKKQYSTRTIVNGIDGYYNDQYLEERTYEENKGLISFKNTMTEDDTDPNQKYTQEDFLFDYAQTEINYP